jgi:hypothetical protein
MSEMAAYITGIDMRVDGGIHHGGGSFLFDNLRTNNNKLPKSFNGFHRDVKAELRKVL